MKHLFVVEIPILKLPATSKKWVSYPGKTIPHLLPESRHSLMIRSEKQLTKYWTTSWLPIKHNHFVNSSTTPPFPKNAPEKQTKTIKQHSVSPFMQLNWNKQQNKAAINTECQFEATKTWWCGFVGWAQCALEKNRKHCLQVAKNGMELTPMKCRASAPVKLQLQLWSCHIYWLQENTEYFAEHIRNCVVS